MNKSQQIYAVTAICLSIVMAGAMIAYRPGAPSEVATNTGVDFRFPSGVGTSLGTQSFTYQGTEPQAKTLSLSGSGSASATANEATVTLGAQTEDYSASVAIGMNADIMDAVITALKAEGLTDDDIQTVSYSVYPRYDWTEGGQLFRGYTVTNIVQVTISDLDKVGAVIDAAAEAGANRIDGVSFQLSDAMMNELKLNAYVAAIEDAEAKAGVITETLGITITGVQSVSESSYVPSRMYTDAVAESAKGSYAPTPILEGSLTVTVSVYIVYLIE
ncbi:hypothetical protein A3K81_00605 [Candidatus Bathyarchaeota archaeon RBG_13_60_20]|nr:MAG: hypothetical protein A3K81_00605 [Candidatus Bathyarchaeota archaeon RBG_13_60_20]